MKKQKYHTVRTVPKSNIERDKIDSPNTYMTAHFPGLEQSPQWKMAWLKKKDFYRPKWNGAVMQVLSTVEYNVNPYI
jgi:hypothetical protein